MAYDTATFFDGGAGEVFKEGEGTFVEDVVEEVGLASCISWLACKQARSYYCAVLARCRQRARLSTVLWYYDWPGCGPLVLFGCNLGDISLRRWGRIVAFIVCFFLLHKKSSQKV